MLLFKILSSFIILGVTCLAGFYPLFKKFQSKTHHHWAESLAVGVFLGAGLLHMLYNASEEFHQQHIQYPIALLLAGASFLVLLLLEHIGRSIYEEQGFGDAFAFLAFCMLSIHSYLTGVALGITGSFSMSLMIVIAVLAHKWAESFSLAIQLNQSAFHLKTKLTLFILFALMLPFGVFSALYLTQHSALSPLFSASANALSAGTFLYLGTLHGLERAVLIKKCCDLNNFTFVICGFSLMAIVALWV